LPRAIKVLADGILVAEPPNVLFIQDSSGDGKRDLKQIVYSGYGDNSDPNIHSYPEALYGAWTTGYTAPTTMWRVSGSCMESG
jgi:hypothetical protein